MTPAMEISTNHHRHAGHEDHTCVELSVDAFTYPDWEADKKSIEKILCKSPSSLADMHARQKLKSMEHKQHMHQGTVVHPGIVKLQTPGVYTYPENATDAQLVLKHYLLGDETNVERILSQIELKQKLFDGNRASDAFLAELDGHDFTYPGWEEDKADVEDTLVSATSGRGCAQFHARRMLKGMENRQKAFEEEGCHPGINVLNSDVFSYATFERDKKVALELYERGSDAGFEQLMKRIKFKQRVEDGDRSHPLLTAIDNARGVGSNADMGFTYPKWDEDLESVEETLINSVNTFAKYDARRQYKGMENKQRLYTGIDLHAGISILNSGVFSYSGFKRDKKDAINEYRCGYDSAFEKRLDRIQKKQQMQDGDRTSPVLKSLDRTAASSPTGQREPPSKPSPLEQQEAETSKVKCTPVTRGMSVSWLDAKRPYSNRDQNQNQARGIEEQTIPVGLDTQPPTQASAKVEPETKTIVIEKEVERFVPDDCVICLEAPRTHIFSACGHLTLCNMCAFKPPYNQRKTRKTKYKCPICRKESKSIQKVYF